MKLITTILKGALELAKIITSVVVILALLGLPFYAIYLSIAQGSFGPFLMFIGAIISFEFYAYGYKQLKSGYENGVKVEQPKRQINIGPEELSVTDKE